MLMSPDSSSPATPGEYGQENTSGPITTTPTIPSPIQMQQVMKQQPMKTPINNIQVQECTQSQDVNMQHSRGDLILIKSPQTPHNGSELKPIYQNNPNVAVKPAIHYPNSGKFHSSPHYPPSQNSYSVVDTTTNLATDNQAPQKIVVNQPIYHHQQPQKQHQVPSNLNALKDDVELNIGTLTFLKFLNFRL